MSDDPFDPSAHPFGCGCGAHGGGGAFACEPGGSEATAARIVDRAVTRAIFRTEKRRRAFIGLVGRATAAAAVASVFLLSTAREAFA